MGQTINIVTTELRREHEKLRRENEKLKEALKTQGAWITRMDALIGKLNTGVLVDSERTILTSTLNSGALLLGANDVPDERDTREEVDSSEGALVSRLKADLKSTLDELQRERRLSECLGVLRKLDWSSLSEGDWYFAADALAAGCRATA
jgi:hypothetical protein